SRSASSRSPWESPSTPTALATRRGRSNRRPSSGPSSGRAPRDRRAPGIPPSGPRLLARPRRHRVLDLPSPDPEMRGTARTRPRTRAARTRSRAAPRPPSYDTVVRFALALPSVEEGTCYGTPALRAGGRFLARLREDGDLAIRCGFEEREILME